MTPIDEFLKWVQSAKPSDYPSAAALIRRLQKHGRPSFLKDAWLLIEAYGIPLGTPRAIAAPSTCQPVNLSTCQPVNQPLPKMTPASHILAGKAKPKRQPVNLSTRQLPIPSTPVVDAAKATEAGKPTGTVSDWIAAWDNGKGKSFRQIAADKGLNPLGKSYQYIGKMIKNRLNLQGGK